MYTDITNRINPSCPCCDNALQPPPPRIRWQYSSNLKYSMDVGRLLTLLGMHLCKSRQLVILWVRMYIPSSLIPLDINMHDLVVINIIIVTMRSSFQLQVTDIFDGCVLEWECRYRPQQEGHAWRRSPRGDQQGRLQSPCSRDLTMMLSERSCDPCSM